MRCTSSNISTKRAMSARSQESNTSWHSRISQKVDHVTSLWSISKSLRLQPKALNSNKKSKKPRSCKNRRNFRLLQTSEAIVPLKNYVNRAPPREIKRFKRGNSRRKEAEIMPLRQTQHSKTRKIRRRKRKMSATSITMRTIPTKSWEVSNGWAVSTRILMMRLPRYGDLAPKNRN